jgi:hypothetical protein
MSYAELAEASLAEGKSPKFSHVSVPQEVRGDIPHPNARRIPEIPIKIVKEAADHQYKIALQMHYSPVVSKMSIILRQPSVTEQIVRINNNNRLSPHGRSIRLKEIERLIVADGIAQSNLIIQKLLQNYRCLNPHDMEMMARNFEYSSVPTQVSSAGLNYLPDSHSYIINSILQKCDMSSNKQVLLGKRTQREIPPPDLSQFMNLSRLTVRDGTSIQNLSVSSPKEQNQTAVETREFGIQFGLSGCLKNQASQTPFPKTHRGLPISSDQQPSDSSVRAVSISIQANFSVVSKKDKATQL